MGKLIPARYIAEHEVVLSKFGGPYLDEHGKPLEKLVLRKGDIIHMDEHEVIGSTWLLDLRAEKDPQYIGVGKRYPANMSDAEAQNIGYQYHEGRRDFEAVVAKPAAKKDDK
jgi:hypothetical protein